MMERISKFIVKKYRHILALSILVFGLSAFEASRIGMDSKMENMMPKDKA